MDFTLFYGNFTCNYDFMIEKIALEIYGSQIKIDKVQWSLLESTGVHWSLMGVYWSLLESIGVSWESIGVQWSPVDSHDTRGGRVKYCGLARALNGGSGWPRGGGSIKKDVDIDVLAT
jgi:hypothetical protein